MRACHKATKSRLRNREERFLDSSFWSALFLSRWARRTICAAMMLVSGSAFGQAPFPSRPVHLFVPYAAGGGVDILARTLGDAVSKQWGQSVVVENRPGAGGVVASQALVSSAPDGYTLMVVASGHATNPFLYPKLPYDTFKDFAPISILASSPNILLVRADSPFKTLADVIAQAKRSRAAFPMASPAMAPRRISPVNY